MSRSGARLVRPRSGIPAALLAAALGLVAALPARPAEGDGARGFELQEPVLQSLHRTQERAVQWLVETDPEKAATQVTDLLEAARKLGLERFPDLARGALMRPVDRARQGDFDLAHQALAAAERLDPERPEGSFAAARVSRLEGRYLAALGHSFRGVARTFKGPFERYLVLEGSLLWAVWLLLAAAGLFV